MELNCINANISIYNNLAACLLASEDHKSEADLAKVVKYTDIVLELDEDNDKALYRKATALKRLKNYSDAKEAYEHLKRLQLNSKDGKAGNVTKEVLTSLKECQTALKEYELKEKSMYQNMFK